MKMIVSTQNIQSIRLAEFAHLVSMLEQSLVASNRTG
jgi:hypothetical protein